MSSEWCPYKWQLGLTWLIFPRLLYSLEIIARIGTGKKKGSNYREVQTQRPTSRAELLDSKGALVRNPFVVEEADYVSLMDNPSMATKVVLQAFHDAFPNPRDRFVSPVHHVLGVFCREDSSTQAIRVGMKPPSKVGMKGSVSKL
ncbi:hypothetical protein KY284_010911 [Solanum tuberosum]|nr:hypothetical protein KY284_010911 [Solanum tuberosum]